MHTPLRFDVQVYVAGLPISLTKNSDLDTFFLIAGVCVVCPGKSL